MENGKSGVKNKLDLLVRYVIDLVRLDCIPCCIIIIIVVLLDCIPYFRDYNSICSHLDWFKTLF